MSSISCSQTTDVKRLEELTRKPVSEWKNLQSLELYDNKLISLPPEIGEWKNLTRFNLCDNLLTSLPPEVKEWQKLKKLYLSGNKFSQTEKDKIKSLFPNTEIEW